MSTERDVLKWRLEYCKLSGEVMGFCRGMAFWELPEDLMQKIVDFADKTEEHYNKLIEQADEEGGDNSHDSTVRLKPV